MKFKDKVAVITGGARGIGACTARRFKEEGAAVEIIDKEEGEWYVGDISDSDVLEEFSRYVISKYGRVDILVNNALPPMAGIDECSWDEFLYSLKVGVAAPFYLSKLFKNYFPPGSSIINIASTRVNMSQAQTESYTAAKGGIAALTHAMAVSLAPDVRVNSISPGWINTTQEFFEGSDASQHLVGRVGTPEDIASMILFLSSSEAGFITGENIVIDGGMTRLMIYHNDCGWTFKQR